MGYAKACSHLPKQRHADAVHFSAAGENIVKVNYVMVKDHAPGENGVLEFDASTLLWRNTHSDATVQRMAKVYVDAWLARRMRA